MSRVSSGKERDVPNTLSGFGRVRPNFLLISLALTYFRCFKVWPLALFHYREVYRERKDPTRITY